MIKYECEKCGREVYTAEAVGADVYLGDIRGASFEFTDALGAKVSMTFEDPNCQLQQFCLRCLFENVIEMLRLRFTKEDIIKMFGWAYEMLPHPEEGLVFDDPADPSAPSEDQELLQLHALGVLSESDTNLAAEGADECWCGKNVEDPECPIHSPRRGPRPG